MLSQPGTFIYSHLKIDIGSMKKIIWKKYINQETLDDWLKVLPSILTHNSTVEDTNDNIFYKCLLKGTLVLKGDRNFDRKHCKERVTLLIGAKISQSNELSLQ